MKKTLRVLHESQLSFWVFSQSGFEVFLFHCFDNQWRLFFKQFRSGISLEILGNTCIAIVCFPGCEVINFENNLIFLIKSLFYMTETSKQKFKHLENELSRWNKRHISPFLKGFQLPKVSDLIQHNCLNTLHKWW